MLCHWYATWDSDSDISIIVLGFYLLSFQHIPTFELAEMKILQAFLQLPISLLVTSFALEATTAPIEAELKYLTPENFKSTIANGVWSVFATLNQCKTR